MNYGIPALAVLLALGGCTLPSNVALKHIDTLRQDQEICLRTNAGYFNGKDGDPSELGKNIAAACRDQTDTLSAYAVPHISTDEAERFRADAAHRAAAYVTDARNRG